MHCRIAVIAAIAIGLSAAMLSPIERDLRKLESDLSAFEHTQQAFVSADGEDEIPAELAPFIKDGKLDMSKAWANNDARNAIAKTVTSGLVNCKVIPSSGEELARQMQYLGKYFLENSPSSDPSASWKQQAFMAWVTEGTGDISSTCGFFPNTLLPMTGYRGTNCAFWKVKIYSDATNSEFAKTPCEAGGKKRCECEEPTFNRKYILRADESGAATAHEWLTDFTGDLGLSKPKHVPPQAAHNFLAFMTWPTWTLTRKLEDVPQDGDIYFIRDPKNGDPGHVGLVLGVDSPDPFTMRTADAGQLCGVPKSHPSGFSNDGWQCIKPTETKRTFHSADNKWKIASGPKMRVLEGFVNVRAMVKDKDNDANSKWFQPETRWTTKEFCDAIQAGNVPDKLAEGVVKGGSVD